MSRGSFGRTVARAAASGGSKNYRARPPMLWYVLMAVIVVGGLFLVGYSRNEHLHPVTAASVHPTTSDNWHAAFAVDICGTTLPNLAANTNIATAGIRTFGDGVIDVDPGAVASNASAFTGKNDTLATFISNYGRGFALTGTSLTLPGRAAHATPSTATTPPSSSASSSSTTSTSGTTKSTSKTATSTNKTTTKAVTASTKATTTKTAAASTTGAAKSTSSTSSSAPSTTSTTPAPVGGPTYRNGTSCPATSKTPGKASLVAKVWTSPTSIPYLVRSNIGAIKILNGQMITLAFVPAGASIPAPPSRSTLVQDLGGATTSSGK